MTMAPGLRSWWQGHAPVERIVIGALLVALLLAVAWIGLWEPLARQVAGGTAQRASVERELEQARADVQETTRLGRAPLPPPADARATLERTLDRAALRGGVAQLDWQADGRVRITFGSIAFTRLVGWLETVHREGGLYVQEATMSALVQPGLVRAELTLGH